MSFITKIKENRAKIKENYDVFIERPRLNPLTKLLYICIKNFQLIIRNKISSLIFIFGPLLIIFLVALSFNNSTLYDLNIATYSETYSSISEGIVTNLSDSQYNVVELTSQEECIDSVKFDDFQVCIIFPSNMILDNSANNIIDIYVDNSRINIANLIAGQISSKVSVEASELSTEIVTQILTVLDSVNTETAQAAAVVDNLQSYNTQLQSSTSSATSEASGLDLSYTTVDTTTIDTEISSIISGNNISSSTFTTLNTYIDSLQDAYSSATSKLSTAEASTTTVNTYLGSISTNLANEEEKITSVDTSLTLIQSQIDTIKITNVDNIVSPIKTSVEPISSSSSYLLYLLPAILVLLVMFVSLLMSSSSIISERASTSHFRNYITPTSSLLPLIGEFISNGIIIGFQIVAMLTLLYFFFDDLSWKLFAFSGIVLFMIASIFIFIGMIIGYLFNTKQSVSLASISLAIILFFFSNTLLPLEIMSSATRKILLYNPFVIGESIIKKMLLFGSGLGEIAFYMYVLGGIIFVTMIGAILAMRLSRHSQI
jgi:ABC-type polysaccharide/polyol phosphate export permease